MAKKPPSQPLAMSENRLMILNPADVEGCIDIASDGLKAHCDSPTIQDLVHRIAYVIATGANNNDAVLTHQQVTFHVYPLE